MSKVYVIINGRNPATGERNTVPERFTDWPTANKWINGVENAKYKGFAEAADREEQIDRWVKKVSKQLGFDSNGTVADTSGSITEVPVDEMIAKDSDKVYKNMVEREYDRMLREANIQQSSHMMRMMPQFEDHCDDLGIMAKEMAEVLQVMFCNVMDYIIGRRDANDYDRIEEEDYEPLPFN